MSLLTSRLLRQRHTCRRAFSSSSKSAASYAFIGLGRMGAPMAMNLAKTLDLSSSKDTLHVYDAYKPALDAFSRDCPDATVAKSSDECVNQADTVITMLPNTSHVESVFQPFLSSSSSSSPTLKGKLFIDSSTIAPAATKKLSEALAQCHAATLVDAPVSGGVVGAKAATLTFMVGHPASSDVPFGRVEFILKVMGKRIIVCGDYAGAGLAAKLANNYALALNNIAACEAMLLGKKLGLQPEILANVLNTSTGKSWPSESNNPEPGVSKGAPAERDYEGGFGVALMRKDLELALEAEREAATVAGEVAKKQGSLSDLSRVALDLYKRVEGTEKYSKKDFSVVYRYLQEENQ